MIALCTTIILFIGSSAQAPIETADEVTRAIEAGKRAILGRISPYDEIDYRPAKKGRGSQRIRGNVTQGRGKIIVIKTTDGRTVKIPRNAIVQWTTPGHVQPEMRGVHFGGPSALAAVALLAAGVPTTDTKLAMLITALAEDDPKTAGTYVRSLRAGVWSTLLERHISRKHRLNYRRLLRSDLNWLERAMQPDGGHGYTADHGHRWDNSNTQFADLGFWAAAVAGIEVPERYWLAIERHWREAQRPDGGWTYTRGAQFSTPSMTVAGCNSLYIVLDRFYAHADRPYARFKGAKPNKNARRHMREIYRAIRAGDTFLGLNPPNITQSHGYELFGLERLGIIGGQAVIGEKDWFRNNMDAVAEHHWGNDLIADAFALVFLVHGQAPVLVQKLQHAAEPDDWNYYHRDLYSLCRYLTRSFERLYRWQRIPRSAGLREMQDAPILYISSGSGLELSQETLDDIRRYIDSGGTVFLHADRAAKAFVKSATAAFEHLFRDQDVRFKKLKQSHPLFHCHFDCRASKPKNRIPFRAISDGPRILVLLCPVDIAGAWHQERQAKFESLFKIMANVRVYVAPPRAALPNRLRARHRIGRPAPPRGSLTLKRIPHTDDWNAHPGAWHRFADGLLHRTGIELTVDAGATPLASPLPADATTSAPVAGPGKPSPPGIIHLTLRRAVKHDARRIAAWRAHIDKGGLMVIDAADGLPAGIAAVRKLMDSLDLGVRGVLAPGHPIVTGTLPGGRPLTDLETTSAGSSLSSGVAPPPILTRSVQGRIAVLACPFDLVAGVAGHFIWKRIGYRPASTADIIDNVFLWYMDQASPGPDRSRGRRPENP